MILRTIAIICVIQIADDCLTIKFREFPNPDTIKQNARRKDETPLPINTLRANSKSNDTLQHEPIMLRRADPQEISPDRKERVIPPFNAPSDYATGDIFLKQKIGVLINDTIKATQRKKKIVIAVRQKYRTTKEYKVGFIMSMIKKSRKMIDELFKLAVKHRENWKALQHLKVHEYIVHCNVDVTSLVAQLVLVVEAPAATG